MTDRQWSEIPCPKCRHRQSDVIDSRGSQRYGIRRRRKCKGCGYRYSTAERVILDYADISLRDLEQMVRDLQQAVTRAGRAKPTAA